MCETEVKYKTWPSTSHGEKIRRRTRHIVCKKRTISHSSPGYCISMSENKHYAPYAITHNTQDRKLENGLPFNSFLSRVIQDLSNSTHPFTNQSKAIFHFSREKFTHCRNAQYMIYENTSRNTFHFRNNDPQGCVECINFDDKSIMAKY